jgi:hypothetical protein
MARSSRSFERSDGGSRRSGARSPSPAPRVQLASSRTELTMTYVQGDNSNFPNYVTILLRRNVPEC